MGWKAHFSRSLARTDGLLHFAAHSHHPWPDVTYDAHQRYWMESAQLLDHKWDHVFGAVRPTAQAHVARHLSLRSADSVTFAPNTHEFLTRILSCLPTDRPLRVLTSDSEFHSLTRQMARLEEDGLVTVTRIPAEPFGTFVERFAVQARNGHDLIYVSQTFFNAGYRLETDELSTIADALPDDGSFFVIDGYHSFLADPVDFSILQDRAFFLSGGYKYAMAGEGVCFLHAPPGYGPRPRNTGWYAAFSALAQAQDGPVAYAQGGARFDGATFDPSGLYRFNAVMDWLEDQGLTIAAMAETVRMLQTQFLAALDVNPGPLRRDDLLVDPATGRCGRFLTFRMEKAKAIHDALAARHVITDCRADRLRIGFGIYHDAEDIAYLVDHLKTI